jgi:hypothetical protein
VSISEEVLNVWGPTIEHPAQHRSQVLQRCEAGQFVQRLNNLELLIFRDLRRGSYPTGGTVVGWRLTVIELEFATHTVEARR